MSRQVFSAIAIAAGLAYLAAIFLGPTATSSDLMASWIAGTFYGLGDAGLIYPPDTTHYTMLVPPEWNTYLDANGIEVVAYPFIYPPLWARIFNGLSAFTTLPQLIDCAVWINQALIAGMVLLAARLTVPVRDMWWHVLIAMVIVYGTSFGLPAVLQNQPQILVSFLIVLAIERSRFGFGTLAGAALAGAAAVKAFPAILALVWLVGGGAANRRAFVSFAICGSVLAGLSLALTGWDLHAAFLTQLQLIGSSVLVTNLSFSIPPAIAQLGYADALEIIRPYEPVPSGRADALWYAMALPGPFRVASVAISLTAITATALFARRKHGAPDVMVWPLLICVLALVSPLAWSYHYLHAVVFAPALLRRLGWLPGAALLLAVFLPQSMWGPDLGLPEIGLRPDQLWGVASSLLLTLGFALAVWRGPAREAVQS